MKAETLKKSILQYAMQGKLVEQNPDDEPASELLKRIKAEKEQLIKDGEIKKEKPLPPITEDEIPYELPQGWEWVRLGKIVSISTGRHDANHATENGQYAFFTCSYTPMKCDTCSYSGKGIILPGNGANVGLSIYYEGDFDVYQRTYVLQAYSDLFLKYVHYMLIGNWKEYNANKLYGGATPYIKLGNIQNYPLALPPLAEQQRIVDKLEQIFPLIEEYGKNEEKLSELNKTLPDKIKQSILQHAVQGKLVPQNLTDEPASELLKRIKSEKEQLIKDGKIKKEKPLPPIKDDEIPYELPQGWEWVRIGEISTILNGYAFKSTSYVKQSDNQIIRLGNVKNSGLLLSASPVYIPSENIDDFSKYKLFSNDILVTLTGTRLKRDYFYTAIIEDKDLDQKNLYLNQRVGCIRCSSLLNIRLINLFLKTNIVLDAIFETETGTANQGNIGTEATKLLLIPLPPLAEQQRIVDKVEELMKIIDDLNPKI